MRTAKHRTDGRNDASASSISFAAPMAYQIFELPFSTTAAQLGHQLEFRTWYSGKAYINVDKISRY